MNMIERVAEAIQAEFDRISDLPDRPSNLVLARAAIEAMREPTKEMDESGRLCQPIYDDPQPSHRDFWKAMIDAALDVQSQIT